MSPRGWPKGKPRGPVSEARKAADRKFVAAGARARHRRKMRAAEVASGRTFGFGLNEDFNPRRGHTDVTPAVWKAATTHVGDYEYIPDGMDDGLLRALENGVVYVSSGCHHQPVFQDITIEVIAAAERYGRKMDKHGRDRRKPSLPAPTPRHLRKRPITAQQLKIIGLLAAGRSATEIAKQLRIKPRTVKAHCDILREKLDAPTRREIPFAYHKRTGRDPFLLIAESAEPIDRVGSSLLAVVEEMFPLAADEEQVSESREGRLLTEVVSEMFDPLKGAL